MDGKQIAKSLAGMIVKAVLAIVIVAVIYKVATNCYNFGYRVFAEEAVDPNGGTDVTVAIVEGKSAKEIGAILKEKGLIRDANLFYVQELVSGEHGKLQAGVYTLNTNMTPKEMIRILAAGPTDDAQEDSGSTDTSTVTTGEGDAGETDDTTQEGTDTSNDN